MLPVMPSNKLLGTVYGVCVTQSVGHVYVAYGSLATIAYGGLI